MQKRRLVVTVDYIEPGHAGQGYFVTTSGEIITASVKGSGKATH